MMNKAADSSVRSAGSRMGICIIGVIQAMQRFCWAADSQWEWEEAMKLEVLKVWSGLSGNSGEAEIRETSVSKKLLQETEVFCACLTF